MSANQDADAIAGGTARANANANANANASANASATADTTADANATATADTTAGAAADAAADIAAAAAADTTANATVLLIDIGNTRLKWAWCDAASLGAPATGALPVPWRTGGACGHEALATLAGDWRALADAEGAPRGVWISNVAGPVIAAEVDALLADAFGGPPAVHWARATASHGTLDNGYREPSQLGVDRWVGGIGARHHLPEGNLMIVTAGTATTIDVVLAPDRGDGSDGNEQRIGGSASNRSGGSDASNASNASSGTPARSRFAGGMILPGLALMMGSLARNTAQLPAVEIGEAHAAAAWADNTRDAIAAGCLAAQAGAIERAWDALTRRGPARCLLSGGAREALAGALTLPFERHENLVLLGLSVMAAQQRGR